MMHNSASENWDDDFEFHSNKTASRRSHQDLDQDTDHNTHEAHPRHSHDSETTENWDDDFAEDDDAASSSPQDPNSNLNNTNSNLHSSINPTNLDDVNSSEPSPSSPSQAGFSLPPPPSANTPRASKIAQRRTVSGSTARVASGSTARARQRSASGSGSAQDWDSSDDEELGFGADEDRTVTARSRRNLASGSYSLNSSPPPPVPPLPGSVSSRTPLLNSVDISGGSMAGTPASSIGRGFGISLNVNIPRPDSSVGLQPFPRSPTASVFSAPDNASIAYTHTSAGSTTALTHPRHHNHLQKAARGLAGLPPSPPIHRERRRLRKKSRPNPSHSGGGTPVVEMREMMSRPGVLRRESSEEGAEGETEEEDWDAEDLAATLGRAWECMALAPG
ncbi:hypothetical protein B0H13DRAFT_1090952 [Mycena leptocephala]|nr:hypothetical protein B0H13DRAFT_1090952 [Mycena leptocephala]